MPCLQATAMRQYLGPLTNTTLFPYDRSSVTTSLERDPIRGNNEQTCAALMAATSIQLGCVIHNVYLLNLAAQQGGVN